MVIITIIIIIIVIIIIMMMMMMIIIIIIIIMIIITIIITIIIIIIIINNAYISILPISPRGSRRAHIFSEEDWNFSRLKLLEISMFLYYKNKATRDTFEENGISEKFS